MKNKSRTLWAALLALVVTSAHGADTTRAGELWVEPPTLIALGFEWSIEGDDNRNARVALEYRKKGSEAWRRGLDLLRLQGEEVWLRGAL
ncbi:MAG: hypothetical protein ABW136_09230, partial [Steroidobacteraceae bacterium]